MVLYIICGILGLNIIIMLYSTAASPFSKHKIKKICTFFSLVILFVCLLFSQEINTTKVSSEKENKYFDAYNVYMDSETFFYYLNDFDLDEVRGGKVKHQYVDYDDLLKLLDK